MKRFRIAYTGQPTINSTLTRILGMNLIVGNPQAFKEIVNG